MAKVITRDKIIAKTADNKNTIDFGFSDNFNGITTNKAIKEAIENKDNLIIEKAQEAGVYNATFNNKHLKANENKNNYLTTQQITNPTIETVNKIDWDVVKPLKGEGTIVDEGLKLSIKHDTPEASHLSMGVLETLNVYSLSEGAYVNKSGFEWTDLGSLPIFINLCFREPIITTEAQEFFIEDSSNERVYVYWPNSESVGLHLNWNALTIGEDNSKYAYEPNSGWKQTSECYVYFTPGIYRFLYSNGDLYLIGGQSIIKLQLRSNRVQEVTCGLINAYSDGLVDAEYYLDKYTSNIGWPSNSRVVSFKSPIADVENEVIYRKSANCPNNNNAIYTAANFYNNDTIAVGEINKTRSKSNGFDGRFNFYWLTTTNNEHIKERAWLF